mmetsp:Transcript_50528/g.126883  ORF Transcript_50528/g.126883 Transcript_50528/m.126883 type:complete len:407 (-) Transcript_50528:496-1716(-)
MTGVVGVQFTVDTVVWRTRRGLGTMGGVAGMIGKLSVRAGTFQEDLDEPSQLRITTGRLLGLAVARLCTLDVSGAVVGVASAHDMGGSDDVDVAMDSTPVGVAVGPAEFVGHIPPYNTPTPAEGPACTGMVQAGSAPMLELASVEVRAEVGRGTARTARGEAGGEENAVDMENVRRVGVQPEYAAGEVGRECGCLGQGALSKSTATESLFACEPPESVMPPSQSPFSFAWSASGERSCRLDLKLPEPPLALLSDMRLPPLDRFFLRFVLMTDISPLWTVWRLEDFLLERDCCFVGDRVIKLSSSADTDCSGLGSADKCSSVVDPPKSADERCRCGWNSRVLGEVPSPSPSPSFPWGESCTSMDWLRWRLLPIALDFDALVDRPAWLLSSRLLLARSSDSVSMNRRG